MTIFYLTSMSNASRQPGLYSPRVPAFDTTRGFAIVMMVFGHTLFLEKQEIYTPTAYRLLYEALIPLRMPVLFFVAGIMASSLRHKSSAALRRRLGNLIWLYILWMPIISIFDGDFALIDHGVVTYMMSVLEIVRSTTILWFLWSLIVCTAAIPLFVRLPPLPGVAMLSIWSVLSYHVSVPWPTIDSLGHFAIFFYAGLIGRDVVLKVMSFKWDPRIFAAMATIAAITRIADTMGLPVPNIIPQTTICGTALYAFSSPLFGGRVGQALGYLGQNSLPIYVIHYPLLVLAFLLFPAFVIDYRYSAPVVLTGTATGISLLAYHAANRFGAAWLFARLPRPSSQPITASGAA